MTNWILLIIAIISVLPLPIWAVKRANRQRPYKAVLLLAFITTGALFYVIVSNYFSAQINQYLIATVYYGVATFVLSLVFLLFGYRGENKDFTPLHETLERKRSGGSQMNQAKPARSQVEGDVHVQDDSRRHGPGYCSGYRPGEGYGYGYGPGQGYGYGGRKASF